MTAEATPGRPLTDLWTRALADPSLRDLPYKVETDEHGRLVLSPHKPRHSLLQSRVTARLRELAPAASLPPGEAATAFAVHTPKGIKVPDVVWISQARLAQLPDDAEASPVMPEIVVEVLSRSNTQTEMEEKRHLYFAGDAREVWTCDPEGQITFYGPRGPTPASALVASFPTFVA